MKSCPTCNKNYSDVTLNYCLQDGAELLDEVFSDEGPETVSLDNFETETVVSKRIPVVLETENTIDHDVSGNPSPTESVQTEEPKRSNTFRGFMLAALGMLLLGGICGVGAYFYFNQNSRYAGGSADNSSSTGSSGTLTDVFGGSQSESEQVKKDVLRRIFRWKARAETRSLDSYMINYAPTVDYYRKDQASKEFVRKDKKKAFEKWTSIKSNFTDVDIKLGDDRKTAVAEFDKEWTFKNDSEENSGKVRSQLKFRKEDGIWRITSEKDLKVYYVNK